MSEARNTMLSRSGPRVRAMFVAVLMVTSIAVLVTVDRRSVELPASAVGARLATPSYRETAQASTWFCPGVPGNDDSIGGAIVVSNPGETPVGGTITRFAVDGIARRQRFAVPARSSLEIDAVADVQSPFVSTLIESQGSPVAVEQRTSHRAGDAVAVCASSPSGTWYLADGFTGADSLEQVVITNPSLDSAILDVSFVTAAGERSPQSLKGVVIPPESVRVFDMAALDARNEAVVAVSVAATVGRVVVGRSQHYLGRGRLGYTMALAASSTSDRWYFADGEKNQTVSEEFVIFNPLLEDQQLTFIVAGDDGVSLDPLVVTAPSKRVTKFSPASLPTLAEGRYSTVITATRATGVSTAGVVVERVTTRQDGKSTATAALLGTPEPSRAWIAPSGTAVGASDSLRIFNPGSLASVFSITYLGPAGDVPVVGLENVALEPGASTSVTLPPEAAATAVTLSSTEPLVVQRRTSRGAKQPINGAAPLIRLVRDARACPTGDEC